MVSRHGILALLLVAASAPASAQRVEDFSEAIEMFRSVPEVAPYFDVSYAYAVWDNIAQGGLGLGGASGMGQVYVNGQVTAFSRIVNISFGLQAGGKAYRQIIFFRDRHAYDEFSRGNFEFDAHASAVAVTANAQAASGTQGSHASVGAAGVGRSLGGSGYLNGAKVFTMATGGLMAELAIVGQSYDFRPVRYPDTGAPVTP